MLNPVVIFYKFPSRLNSTETIRPGSNFTQTIHVGGGDKADVVGKKFDSHQLQQDLKNKIDLIFPKKNSSNDLPGLQQAEFELDLTLPV